MGSNFEEVCFDKALMDDLHILLGRSRLYNHNMTHHTRSNIYTLWFKGKKSDLATYERGYSKTFQW